MRNISYLLVLALILSAWFFGSPHSPPHVETKKALGVLTDISVITSLESVLGEVETGTACNIEYINGQVMGNIPLAVQQKSNITLTGWALDSIHERIPDSVFIRFTKSDGKHFYAKALAGLERNDVIDYLSLDNNSMINSGFELVIDGHSLEPSEYDLSLLMFFDDKLFSCHNGRKFLLQQ